MWTVFISCWIWSSALLVTRQCFNGLIFGAVYSTVCWYNAEVFHLPPLVPFLMFLNSFRIIRSQLCPVLENSQVVLQSDSMQSPSVTSQSREVPCGKLLIFFNWMHWRLPASLQNPWLLTLLLQNKGMDTFLIKRQFYAIWQKITATSVIPTYPNLIIQ